MSDLVQRLWDSDQASALTNEAAREIERLREVLDLIANTGMDARQCMLAARQALAE